MNNTKNWTKAAGIRAIKTAAQTLTALITVGATITDVDWKVAVSTAALAAIYSILTSIAGLPEVEEVEETEEVM